jgi:hypothetical protein
MSAKVEPIKGCVHVCNVRSDDGWTAMCCLWDGARWLYWDSELEPHGWEPVTDINCVVEEWDFPTMVPPAGSPMSALMDVRDERMRQRTKLGWTEAHDDTHTDGFLATLAAVKALCAADKDGGHFQVRRALSSYFDAYGLVHERLYNGNVRDLLKEAGALIIAEMERLDRAAIKRTTP